MDEALERVLATLGHEFSDPSLFEQALTHRSAGARNNERLEFLGDAILNFVVADALYRSTPDAKEGSLTRRRARLVRRETLAEVAREIGLGPALRLGGGEMKSGGRDRDSILADALEGLIGAVYLDAGLEICAAWLSRQFGARLTLAFEDDADKDAKTRLQEMLQSKGLPLPVYTVVGIDGAAHEQSFTVQCRVSGLVRSPCGTGGSRRKAEQVAADRALSLLDETR